MQLINIAAVSLNQTPLDWRRNQRNILNALEEARRQQATMVCLPELSITGYGCEDAFLSPHVQARAIQSLAEIIPHTADLIVSVGLPIMCSGRLYNCAAIIANQSLVGFVAKNQLAGDGIHYEPRWFKAWSQQNSDRIQFEGKDYPIGNLLFDFNGIRVGFEICEDAWAATRPGSELASNAVDIILNPSASHFAFGKQDVRRRLVMESSRAFGVTYVYANLLGNEAGRVIYDGAAVIASHGKIVGEGPRLSFCNFEVVTAGVDVDATRMNRASLASFQPKENGQTIEIVDYDFEFPEIAPSNQQSRVADWESSDFVKEEEFSRAVALGLFDYLRKSRAGGFVVSLSGGADSSGVAILVWLASKFGLQQLGQKEFVARLPGVAGLTSSDDAKAACGVLLTTIYQATQNSTRKTEAAAEHLANDLGSRHIRLDVDPMVESYVDAVSDQIDRKLNWNEDDIALQNIQARSRAPGVWLIANLQNALLLATSNRSEAAVGYATMDGDTCGGLSPIAGIDKAFLMHWLRWMHEHGPQDIGNVPSLEPVLDQKPTAELRPQNANQTDEDDLMPYEILDWIERAAIRDKYGPIDILKLMKVEFSQFGDAQLGLWIEKFFRLWSRNQWKRERYAPSFHLDDENLDPKTWCRFPILSGGFELELEELRQLVDETGKSAEF